MATLSSKEYDAQFLELQTQKLLKWKPWAAEIIKKISEIAF
jgi:hypothetical protein